jgi:hypothetical protein
VELKGMLKKTNEEVLEEKIRKIQLEQRVKEMNRRITKGAKRKQENESKKEKRKKEEEGSRQPV